MAVRMNIFLSLSLLFFTFAPLPSIRMWFGLWKFGGLKNTAGFLSSPRWNLCLFLLVVWVVCVCVCVGGGMGGEREIIENRERKGFDA